MHKTIRSILVGLGVIFIIIIVCGLALRAYLSSSLNIQVYERINSPDQSHAATLFSDSGGGGPGWCSHVVVVTSADKTFESLTESNRLDFEIYSGSCDIKPKIQWVDSSKLQLILNLGKTHGVSMHLKALDKSQKIAIKYVLLQP